MCHLRCTGTTNTAPAAAAAAAAAADCWRWLMARALVRWQGAVSSREGSREDSHKLGQSITMPGAPTGSTGGVMTK